MKPRVIIDSLSLLSPLTGVGRYTFENAREIVKLNRYQLTYFYGYASRSLVMPSSAKRIKSLRSWLVKNAMVKSIMRNLMFRISGFFTPRYDLYWQPNFIPNHSIKASKVIATVHDFSWEVYPEFQPPERVDYFQKYFYTSITRCDHIITGSQFTRQEIVERTGISLNKISVIYHGVNHGVFYPRLTKKPDQKYILAVGSIEPRKNLKNLLIAYALLDESFRDEYHLILVGAQGWNNDEIVSDINKLSHWVRYSGYVTDEALAELYSNAATFIYPSLYEGFGIPPLEAMSCGTPVIVSNVSSLPEVCADAAYYIDPMDCNSIKDGIVTVLNNSSLQKELVVKGLIHAKVFSWKKSADDHRRVFDKVLKG